MPPERLELQIQSLQIIAGKLNEKEYKTVSGSMFRLYMGDKLGYRDQFDPQFMADITGKNSSEITAVNVPLAFSKGAKTSLYQPRPGVISTTLELGLTPKKVSVSTGRLYLSLSRFASLR